MKHRLDDEDIRNTWQILKAAGIGLIMVMFVVLLLIAVAVGFLVEGRLV